MPFRLGYDDDTSANGTLYSDDVTIAGYTVGFVYITTFLRH